MLPSSVTGVHALVTSVPSMERVVFSSVCPLVNCMVTYWLQPRSTSLVVSALMIAAAGVSSLPPGVSVLPPGLLPSPPGVVPGLSLPPPGLSVPGVSVLPPGLLLLPPVEPPLPVLLPVFSLSLSLSPETAALSPGATLVSPAVTPLVPLPAVTSASSTLTWTLSALAWTLSTLPAPLMVTSSALTVMVDTLASFSTVMVADSAMVRRSSWPPLKVRSPRAVTVPRSLALSVFSTLAPFGLVMMTPSAVLSLMVRLSDAPRTTRRPFTVTPSSVTLAASSAMMTSPLMV